jgi:hypothetical protein
MNKDSFTDSLPTIEMTLPSFFKSFQGKRVLAPMVRVGTLPLRLLAKQYGAGKCTPPTSTDSVFIVMFLIPPNNLFRFNSPNLLPKNFKLDGLINNFYRFNTGILKNSMIMATELNQI